MVRVFYHTTLCKGPNSTEPVAARKSGRGKTKQNKTSKESSTGQMAQTEAHLKP